MDKTSLGDRMKSYEVTSKFKLLKRTPTIIRLDGKAFHTWTKQLKHIEPSLKHEPFSDFLHSCMVRTALFLIKNIQNAVLAYSQSDEISILLNDWKSVKTDQWFDGKIQKISSVSASFATGAFNRGLPYHMDLAFFDSRVFNLPFDEVVNYFIWRQQDATRNSINMLGQYYFSHKDLQEKNTSVVQDMLMKEYNINWNDLDVWKKRGFCVSKEGVDENIPIFTQDRYYIEKHLRKDNG